MAKKQTLSHYKEADRINSFFLKHAAILVNRTPRTLRRWVKKGKIRGRQAKTNNWWFFRLSDINLIREEDGLPPISGDQAIAILEKEYPDEVFQ